MTSRERVLCALRHQEADRVPIHDTLWPHTLDRWHREGLPSEPSPADQFGYAIAGLNADLSFQFSEEVIDETDAWTIERDAYGLTFRKFKDHQSVPEQIDFIISSRAAWEEHKPRLAWNDARVDWPARRRAYADARAKGKYVQFGAGFGFDLVRRFVGGERLLIALVEEPGWVKDMFDTIADLIITAAAEMIQQGLAFDGAFLWNDMGYRNGTFFSPVVYRALEFPAQKRMCDFFRSHGMPIILHTDGDIRKLIPMLIEAGFTCLSPLEVKAGLDVVALKRDFGDRLAFMGGIDTRTMADPDPSVIEREISTKVPVAKIGGGYIYHSDHSVPDNVSLDQYRRVLELVARYGGY